MVKWFIIILKNIMLKGTGAEFVWKESLILAGMTLFLSASVCETLRSDWNKGLKWLCEILQKVSGQPVRKNEEYFLMEIS